MLDLARIAEKRVESTRKDGYEFYNPEQWERGKRAADIISHLPAAIQNGEIHVWYQPQVNYKTGKIVGAEALCRWNHAKLGWLRPESLSLFWKSPDSSSIWTVTSGKGFAVIFKDGIVRGCGVPCQLICLAVICWRTGTFQAFFKSL